MAYNATNWQDHITPTDAEHLNNIEDGISTLDNDKADQSDVDELKTSKADQSDLDALSTKVDEETKTRAEKDDEQDEKIQSNTDLIDSSLVLLTETYDKSGMDATTTDLQYTGYSLTVPANSLLYLSVLLRWTSGRPRQVVIATDEDCENIVAESEVSSTGSNVNVVYFDFSSSQQIYYIFGSWATGSAVSCRLVVDGCYLHKA